MHRVIGIDPGPTPGIAVFNWLPGGSSLDAHVLQCDHGIAPNVLDGLLHNLANSTTLVAVEKFVIGGRSGRSSTASAGAITRDLVGQLQQVVASRGVGPHAGRGVRYVDRSASAVKPWATDRRLAELGLVDLTTGMRHARDACRHALFAAVHDLGLPDPLSRAGRGLPSLKGDS